MKTTIHTHSTPTAIAHAARAIREGQVAVIPTETVYGMAADATNPAAVAAIFRAKGRPSDNPLIVHLAQAEEAEKYAFTCPLFYQLAEAFMPGPLTIILPKRDCIPHITTGGQPTVAVRVPASSVAREIIRQAGVPVAAPSANISGRPSCTAPSHVIEDCVGRVRVILCDGQCEIGLESTVVSLEGGNITILRPGGVAAEMLRHVCPSVNVLDMSEARLSGEKAPPSPGMKYRHYAPRGRLILLEGDVVTAQRYYEQNLFTPNTRFFVPTESSLFSTLRQFDSEGVEVIYVALPEDASAALVNRLRRATE